MRFPTVYPLIASLLLLPSPISAKGTLGDSCIATDTTSTGPTTTCISGYCRSGGCSDPTTISALGEACSDSSQCVGAESYNDQPASCAGLPDGQATCGGASAYCLSAEGGFTGPSAICASNNCKNGQCADVNGVAPGGTCIQTYECSGNANCRNGICDDQGFACAADSDGTPTGASAACDTGYCRQGGCASFPSANLGEACLDSNACIGAESYNDQPAGCAGLPGKQATCGGASAYCLTEQGGFTGPSAICASNNCKNGQCADVNGVAPGDTCVQTYECLGNANCVNGICDDQGFACAADGDGSPTGATSACDTGYCRQGGCASFPSSNLGEACSDSNKCVSAESYNDQPASCAGLPRKQATCGGASAYCLTEQGGFTGPSAICASNNCKNGQCADVNGIAPGGTCTQTYECLGNANCLNGICDDQGFACAADADGTPTGPSAGCDTGYCRQGGCASFPSSNLGQACSDSNRCVGVESYNDQPASCAGPSGVRATCGGGTAYCLTMDGGFSGPSPICASSQCANGQCKRVDPVANGAACQGDYDCGGYIHCVQGSCTGGEDSCAADDGNGQQIGASHDCSSGFCRAGQCSNVPPALLGDVCDDDRDCAGSDNNPSVRTMVSCGVPKANIRRCGSGGAFCYTPESTGSGPAPDICISGQCFQYACTDAAPSPGLGRRDDAPTQHVIEERLCPNGFEPCPLYPKGYDCIDILNDIESCGGCVGRNMPGIDCSADVHAAEVSCIAGQCKIAACEIGYVVAIENNTCIAE